MTLLLYFTLFLVERVGRYNSEKTILEHSFQIELDALKDSIKSLPADQKNMKIDALNDKHDIQLYTMEYAMKVETHALALAAVSSSLSSSPKHLKVDEALYNEYIAIYTRQKNERDALFAGYQNVPSKSMMKEVELYYKRKAQRVKHDEERKAYYDKLHEHERRRDQSITSKTRSIYQSTNPQPIMLCMSIIQ